MFIPAMCSAGYWGRASNGGIPLLYFIAGLAVALFVSFKLVRLAKRRQQLKLGLDAELAVAQSLYELMYRGYRVFHDFPADNFNIDHIAVGSNGKFAVETKGRNKPYDRNGKVQWEVQYNRRALQFPGWKEEQPVRQAKAQASWLQNWLSKAVGEDIPVQAVQALPGWYVQRTAKEGIWLGNHNNLKSLGQYPTGRPLTEKLVRQIEHQLDQRSRSK